MSTILVNPEDLRNSANKIRTYSNEIRDTLIEMKNRIDSLDAGWEGDAKEFYVLHFKEYSDQFRRINDSIDDFAANINLAADAYDEVDHMKF